LQLRFVTQSSQSQGWRTRNDQTVQRCTCTNMAMHAMWLSGNQVWSRFALALKRKWWCAKLVSVALRKGSLYIQEETIWPPICCITNCTVTSAKLLTPVNVSNTIFVIPPLARGGQQWRQHRSKNPRWSSPLKFVQRIVRDDETVFSCFSLLCCSVGEEWSQRKCSNTWRKQDKFHYNATACGQATLKWNKFLKGHARNAYYIT